MGIGVVKVGGFEWVGWILGSEFQKWKRDGANFDLEFGDPIEPRWLRLGVMVVGCSGVSRHKGSIGSLEP